MAANDRGTNGGAVELCIHAKTRNGQTAETAISNLEAEIGRRFAAHKDFFKWGDAFPSRQQLDDARKGRTPAINWIARRRDGRAVPWRTIAAGAQDAVISAFADGIRRYRHPVYLTFHHEPENDRVNGSPAEFIAAFRHIRRVFTRRGVTNVRWVAALMATTFVKGEPGRWYPGDDYVDMVGLNGYNWHPGKPGSTWRSLADIFRSAYVWAAARGKRVMITETGVQEDGHWAGPGNRKALWFRDALTTLKRWPLVKVFCYWHSNVRYPWWVDTSAASLRAFRDISNDPYMRAVP